MRETGPEGVLLICTVRFALPFLTPSRGWVGGGKERGVGRHVMMMGGGGLFTFGLRGTGKMCE